MKKLTILTVSLLLLISCGNEKKQNTLPCFDVNESYPKKEIILQDIANVEYISLETRDDVLVGGGVVRSVGKDKILIYSGRTGDVFIFNNDGKFINKFNHKGQSGEEYNYISNILIDEPNDDIFIIDGYKKDQILVYSMHGKYKRTITIKDVEASHFSTLFGKEQILSYQNPNRNNIFSKEKKEFKHNSIAFINRTTGAKEKEIILPTTLGVSPYLIVTVGSKSVMIASAPELLVDSKEGLIINEIACDTIFALGEKQQLKPILTRTPKVSPQDKPLKMLGIDAISSDAIYLEVELKEYDLKNGKGFTTTDYQLQRSNNKVVEYTLKNEDVPSKETLATLKSYKLIQAIDLIELLEEGRLKGKLKTIAEKLEEDDNPVLMKVTLK